MNVICNVMSLIFVILYCIYIILTIKLSIKSRNMSPALLAYGVVISLIHIVYLCIVEKETIYVNIIYLIAMVILLLLNILNAKKRAQKSNVLDLLIMLSTMLVLTGEISCIITIIGTLIATALYILIGKIKRNKSLKNQTKIASTINIVLIMGILNIFTFFILINVFR